MREGSEHREDGGSEERKKKQERRGEKMREEKVKDRKEEIEKEEIEEENVRKWGKRRDAAEEVKGKIMKEVRFSYNIHSLYLMHASLLYGSWLQVRERWRSAKKSM